MNRHLSAALVVSALLVLGAGPAQAQLDQVTFIITSEHPNIIDVEFYSQDRNHAWPGGSKVYTISDYNTKHYTLNCVSGEKICYGAGVRGRYSQYWGVGIGNRQSCIGCCFVCGGGATRPIVLNP
jgi:hypothetical protein